MSLVVCFKPITVMTGAMMEYHVMVRQVNQQDLGLDRSYQLPPPHARIEDPDAQSSHDSGIDDGDASDLLSQVSNEPATPANVLFGITTAWWTS